MPRYARAAWATIGLVGVMMATSARAADGPGIEAKTAFAKLKTLAGEWKVEGEVAGHGGGHEQKVIYRVTSNGSALMQHQFPDTDHEIISMYHLDGNDLKMTHYCAIGNQPRMKLDRQASTPDVLVFVFDGGTNFNPAKDLHIHALKTSFKEGGKVEEAWDAFAGGKKAHGTTFVLSRVKP